MCVRVCVRASACPSESAGYRCEYECGYRCADAGAHVQIMPCMHTDTHADILTCVFTFRCYGDVSCVEDGGRGIDTMVEHEISGLAEALLDQECSRPAAMSFNNVDLQVCLFLCRCRRCQCLSVCSPICLHVQSCAVRVHVRKSHTLLQA